MALLHSHAEEALWFEEIFLHGILDTIKIIPFLFLTYLLMEFIEHRADGRLRSFIAGSGRLGPLAGGLLGAVPQCGFSAVGAGLYAGRVITTGTLLAIFLSTSDEMLPLLISSGAPITLMLKILASKAVIAAIAGFAVDGITRIVRRGKKEDIATAVDRASGLPLSFIRSKSRQVSLPSALRLRSSSSFSERIFLREF